MVQETYLGRKPTQALFDNGKLQLGAVSEVFGHELGQDEHALLGELAVLEDRCGGGFREQDGQLFVIRGG